MDFVVINENVSTPKAYRYMEDNDSDGVVVKLFEVPIIKFTPCGYWVKTAYDNKGKHFVNTKNALKKYAHLNKEDALESFIERKKHQVSICKSRLWKAQDALKVGERLKETLKNSNEDDA